uniref:Uncharacterized protein n=1 Tax=Utricularia reniformis TaxID=192314 RepID=A0A1Y0B2Q3_9LAMI|nr:hypothetical protein AEK19_MT1477 [Utricularia reniformis]ART31667.1 hypothetical protein AEK19_MT1477 [Utricularia reniformis]
MVSGLEIRFWSVVGLPTQTPNQIMAPPEMSKSNLINNGSDLFNLQEVATMGGPGPP